MPDTLRKAFDRVWHRVLIAILKGDGLSASLVSRLLGAMRSMTSLDRRDDVYLEEKYVKANQNFKIVFKGFDACKTFLGATSKHAEEYFDQLNKMLREKVVHIYGRYTQDEERKMLGTRLGKIEFVEVLVEYYNFVLDEFAIEAVTNDFVEDSFQKIEDAVGLILTIREIIEKYSKYSHVFAEKLMETPIIGQFLNDLDKMHGEGLKELEVLEDISAFTTAVGTIHNCAQNPNVEKERFRDLRTAERLKPFLDSNLINIRIMVLLAVTEVLKEDDAFIDRCGEDSVNFLFESLVNATQSKDRKEQGFSVTSLLLGITSFARAHKCKRMIMDLHPLSVINKLLRGIETDETVAAANLLWELSFHEDNKRIIKRDKELMTTLEILKKNRNHDVQYAVRMTWFILIGKDDRIRNTVTVRTGRHTPYRFGMGGKHIMVSYSWGDQAIVHEICGILKREGYPLWIDISEMNKFATTLDGHMYGVEHAYAVILFYSEKYKNTRTCRLEAEYAFVKKKELIAVKVERGYVPEGWLRPVLGNRHFIEFSPMFHFDNQMDRLRRALPMPPRTPTVMGHYPAVDERLLAPTPAPLSRKLLDWTKDDIEYWAIDNRIEGISFKRLCTLNGDQLLYAYKLYDRNEAKFLLWAEKTFNFGCPEELLKFKHAIRSLSSNV